MSRRIFVAVFVIYLSVISSGCAEPVEPMDPTAKTVSSVDADSTLLARIEFSGDTSNLPDAAKVFVFIREKGKTMPLAVEQFAPTDLPVQVGFSKPEASVQTVEAIARLSLTGGVMKHPNDPEIVSEALSTENYGRSIQLVIPQTSLANGDQNSGIAVRFAVTIPAEVQPSATAKLFVIAKMEDGLNPMPVAVKAHNIDDIPAEIVLTDKDSMMSVARLSRNKRIQVIARLSQSGTTKKQPGDWESLPQLVDTKNTELTNLILTEAIQ